MVGPRISAGKYKGHFLEVPSNARPATQRFKIKLMDMLSDHLEGANILDVFSGSGLFGIEALSRGAKHVDFVDNNSKATKIIKENIESIGIPKENYRVIKRNYISQTNAEAGSYDLIFADPPFTKFEEYKLHRLLEGLNEGGLLLVKAPLNYKSKYLNLSKERIILKEKVGKNVLLVMQ